MSYELLQTLSFLCDEHVFSVDLQRDITFSEYLIP